MHLGVQDYFTIERQKGAANAQTKSGELLGINELAWSYVEGIGRREMCLIHPNCIVTFGLGMRFRTRRY